MSQKDIKCPKCGWQFELTEGISREIEATVSQKFISQMSALKSEAHAREIQLKEQFKSEKHTIAEQAKKDAAETLKIDLEAMKSQLAEKSNLLEESRQQELAIRKRQRVLEEREKTLELEAMRTIDAEKDRITEEAKCQVEEQHRLRDAEKDKKLADMNRQIDDLKRKAEQGSQQSQGEILELDLQGRLHSKFPIDEVEPVQKGVKGADILEIVKSQFGQVCGRILWESKRTKAWSDSWIQKAKDDQLAAKADVVVIMTEVLPKGVQQFDHMNGVWVTDILSAINLAIALRAGMIQVDRERAIQVGKQEKMAVVYNYLTGPEFKNRVEAILGSFVTMQGDLEKEKRALGKIWARREKQIERVIHNISGMHGDLEGIAGKVLPAIKLLDLGPQEEAKGGKDDDVAWLEEESQS